MSESVRNDMVCEEALKFDILVRYVLIIQVWDWILFVEWEFSVYCEIYCHHLVDGGDNMKE